MPQSPPPSTTPCYEPPPGPTRNGGLYTGAPFVAGATWANVPVTPDAGYMMLVNLPTAGGVPDLARHHLPGGGLRPGNNTPLLPREWTDRRVPHLGMICVPPATQPDGGDGGVQRQFRAHAYLPTLPAHAWRACASK